MISVGSNAPEHITDEGSWRQDAQYPRREKQSNQSTAAPVLMISEKETETFHLHANTTSDVVIYLKKSDHRSTSTLNPLAPNEHE